MDLEGKKILLLLLEQTRRDLKDLLERMESAIEILRLQVTENEKPDRTDRARGDTSD